MRMQPVLHHGRISGWSRLVFVLLNFGLVGVGASAVLLGGLAALLLWIPTVIIVGVVATIWILMNPRKRWDQTRNFYERNVEAAGDAVSHISTAPNLIAERYAERDGGGVFIAMASGRYRNGRREPSMITLRDDRHVTMIAGSRVGKGRAVILNNLARWKGSVIVTDPAGELLAASGTYRRDVLGQRVVVLDPFGVTGWKGESWNPFDEIQSGDPFTIEKLRLIAESLIEREGGDPYWTYAPRSMLSGVSAHVLTAATADARNLYTVRQLLTDETPDAVWFAMKENPALDGLVRQAGQENASRDARELSNVLQSARVATDWIDSPAMRAITARSTFSMSDLKRERVSLYLVLPPGLGATFSKWLRLLFDMAFFAMQNQAIPKPADEVLFLLDEFPLLGRMDRIKRAAGESAKFGVKLFVIAQDVGQLREIYGDAWETFIANSFLTIMFGTNDLASQEYASSRIGKGWFTKVTTSTGGQGGSSTTTSQELNDIARPNEISRSASREAGRMYVFVAGQKPWLLPRANYDEWDMFARPAEALAPDRGGHPASPSPRSPASVAATSVDSPPPPASPTVMADTDSTSDIREPQKAGGPPPVIHLPSPIHGETAPRRHCDGVASLDCPAVARFTTGTRHG